MNEFHVILPSNAPGDGNEASHYITTCKQHIELEGEWKVGLTEISFYKDSVSCPKGAGFHQHFIGGGIVSKYIDLEPQYPSDSVYDISKDEDGIQISRIIKEKDLRKIELYVDEASTPYVTYEAHGFFIPVDLPVTTKKIRLDEHYHIDQKVTIALTENKTFESIVHLIKAFNNMFSDKLRKSDLLNHPEPATFTYENDRVKCTFTNMVNNVKFFGGLQFILGFESSLLSSDTIAPFPPQLHRGIGSMYVYSNICTNTQVGNVLVPLLRQIVLPPPTKTQMNGMIEKLVFDSPMYVPVKLKTINSIEIEVRTNSGDYFPFLDDSVTTATLHFKKRYE